MLFVCCFVIDVLFFTVLVVFVIVIMVMIVIRVQILIGILLLAIPVMVSIVIIVIVVIVIIVIVVIVIIVIIVQGGGEPDAERGSCGKFSVAMSSFADKLKFVFELLIVQLAATKS